MQKDDRDVLEVLKFELQFIEKGGYGRSPREPWRPQFIFEDSPTCMNYDCKENPAPCTECVLIQLVPPKFRSQDIPCRHIPLNACGETLDSLYRCGDQYEIEEEVKNWLKSTIAHLEDERRSVHREVDERPRPPGEATKGTPLYQSLHPKCANPACPTAFHWLAGGKFFRFRPAQAVSEGDPGINPSIGHHGVLHYWLCERCSRVFTLFYEEREGVVLRLLWTELPLAEAPKELPAA